MKLDGRSRIVYECDNATKRKTTEGSVHAVLNREGLEAMLLDRSMCTKEMEHRVMNALNGIGEWYGPEIRDILYTHGKFKGYVFYKEEEPEPETVFTDPVTEEGGSGEIYMNDPTQNNRRPSSGGSVPGSYNTAARSVYLIASLVLMGLVTKRFLYPSMLQRAYLTGSDTGAFFSSISINGFLGIGVGVIVALICGRYLFSANPILYYVLVPVSFIVSAALLYLVLQLVIGLATAAVSIFVALLPTAIIIIAIVYVIKTIFK